jgi:hypothetical protein
MDDPRHSEPPPELARLARRLQEERSTLSGLELDQIKLAVERRAARPENTFLSKQRRTLMKSRMAIMSMLMLGVLASGTGTGLAVSGLSDNGSAGKAQYPTPPGKAQSPPPNKVPADVLGEQEDGGGNGGGNEDDTDVAGTQGSDGDTDVAGAQEGDVQATRQVSVQEEGNLPFTGLAAIPLILMGVGLLASGMVLRRRLPDGA